MQLLWLADCSLDTLRLLMNSIKTVQYEDLKISVELSPMRNVPSDCLPMLLGTESEFGNHAVSVSRRNA